MSACPAYLGVVINNRLELDELFRYDLLILCPADFNLTFKVNAACSQLAHSGVPRCGRGGH